MIAGLENPDDLAAEAGPKVALPARYIAALLIANLAMYVAWIAPVYFSMAIRLEQINPAHKTTALALAVGIPSFVVMLTGPLLGVISDRTKSRLGRRRFWFLLGTLCGFAGSLIVGLAHSIAVVIPAWTAAFIGYASASGMLGTHLGDRLPEAQRGRVSGLNSAVTSIGPVIGIVIAGRFTSVPLLMLIIPAIIALAGGLFFSVVMNDPLPESEPGGVEMKAILDGFWFDPRKHRSYAWVWLSRAFVYLSISFTSVYAVYLLSARLHIPDGMLANRIATAGLVGLPAGVFGALASGWVSDRLKSRKPFLVISAIVMAISALVTATLTSLPQYYAGVLIGALGIGAYGATDAALVLDVLPQEENQNGRYLALIGLANALPMATGPFLAGFVIKLAHGDYTWVYYDAAMFAVIGALLILPVRYVWRETKPAEVNELAAQP